MGDEDDVIRLGRDPDRVPVRLRDVLPWWLLGGAILNILLIVALAPLSPAASGLGLWVIAIGVTIRDRRADIRRLLVDTTLTAREVAEAQRRHDPAIAIGVLAIGFGLSLLIGNLIRPREEIQWPLTLTGFALMLLGAAVFVLVILHERRDRSASE